MSNPNDENSPLLDEDLQKLELGIRQLKIEYDRFLAGGLKREPLQLRFGVQKQIKRYNDTRGKKYHHRFHFNALVSRFVTLSEMWSKRIRAQEVGSPRAPARSAPPVERCLASCRISDANQDPDSLREIYDRFVEAREKSGDNRGKITFEKFVSGVASQTRRLQNDAGCGEIELRLIVSDQKVQLKALRG